MSSNEGKGLITIGGPLGRNHGCHCGETIVKVATAFSAAEIQLQAGPEEICRSDRWIVTGASSPLIMLRSIANPQLNALHSPARCRGVSH